MISYYSGDLQYFTTKINIRYIQQLCMLFHISNLVTSTYTYLLYKRNKIKHMLKRLLTCKAYFKYKLQSV